MSVSTQSRPRITPPNQNVTKTAVLMDAGAVFFAVRDMQETAQFNYQALMQLLSREGFPLPVNGGNENHLWVLWSAVVSHNTGQVRFLQYAERELGWTVRQFHPTEGYVVDPATLGLSSGGAQLANRLLRFDASIAFAIGHLAKDHRVAVVSDSFALAEPLLRAARMSGRPGLLSFFGRLLDPRWQTLLRDKADTTITFVDLDQHEDVLFGSKKTVQKTGWTDDFLVK